MERIGASPEKARVGWVDIDPERDVREYAELQTAMLNDPNLKDFAGVSRMQTLVPRLEAFAASKGLAKGIAVAEKAPIWILKDKPGSLAGFAALKLRAYGTGQEHVLQIDRLYLRKDRRDDPRFFHLFLKKLDGFCKDHHVAQILMDVHSNNEPLLDALRSMGADELPRTADDSLRMFSISLNDSSESATPLYEAIRAARQRKSLPDS